MKVLISGSHGLVGSALGNSLKSDSHEVFALVRHAPHSESEVEWYPDRGSLALSGMEGMDSCSPCRRVLPQADGLQRSKRHSR
jgi:NAD dependent epimerase/dehydratase family enzyme